MGGDKHDELLAEGMRYLSEEDWRRAARAFREAIALRPDDPSAYFNLGLVLHASGQIVEAAKCYLGAVPRFPVGSEDWADAIAEAFRMLSDGQYDEVVYPEWWNDEGLKALSARVLWAAPNSASVNVMRAHVLSGCVVDAWEVGSRSKAELEEAATLFDRAVALCNAPAWKSDMTFNADACRSQAEAM